MFPPKDLEEYLNKHHIDSGDTDRIRYAVTNDTSINEETRARWLKYCKKATIGTLILGAFCGMPDNSDKFWLLKFLQSYWI